MKPPLLLWAILWLQGLSEGLTSGSDPRSWVSLGSHHLSLSLWVVWAHWQLPRPHTSSQGSMPSPTHPREGSLVLLSLADPQSLNLGSVT